VQVVRGEAQGAEGGLRQVLPQGRPLTD
jgi:hypothetical protein